MPRGGAGRNQGRKKAEPDFWRRWAIGARCEQIRREASEQGAWIRHSEAWEEVEKVRKEVYAERKRYHDRVMRLRDSGLISAAKAEVQKFKAWEGAAKEKITKAFERNRGRKNVVSSAKRYRPKPLTREEVYSIVALEYGTTTRRVRAYWIEYNKFQARVNSQKSG
jgi:hypothetical protein